MMGEIRKAFEKRAGNMGYNLKKRRSNRYKHLDTLILETGYLMAVEDYRFKDERIQRLENALNHIIAVYGEQLGVDFCNFISEILENRWTK